MKENEKKPANKATKATRTSKAAQPAKATKATVYIDVDDEITSIIDKMESTEQKVVALVLPKRAALLQSIVNMRLLKRSADNAGKNAVLITSEEALMPLAGAAGLHVADSLNSRPYVPVAPAGIAAAVIKKATETSEITPEETDEPAADEVDEDLPKKIDYKKSVGELAAVHDGDIPETIELGDEEDSETASGNGKEKPSKASKDKKLKVPDFDRFRLRLFGAIAGVIALIVFIYLALAVLPKATVAIQTTSTPVSANLTVTTQGTAKSVDTKNNIIPGYSKTTDQNGTQTVPATGQQNNGIKATGTVTMSTKTDCATDVSKLNVPAGTGITSGGLTFVTQKSTNFKPPPASGCTFTSDVTVVAQQGGAKYNLPSGSAFAVNGRSDVTGSGSSSGGTDNILTVISQSDVDNAVAKLKGSTATNFVSNFETALANQGYYVFAGTLTQANPVTTANPAVGQQASSTTVTIKITYSVLAVKKDDLSQVIKAAVAKQIDPTKQKLDQTDIIRGATIGVGNQSSPTNATLNIAESTSAVPILDAASLKKQIAGKKKGDISEQISSIPGVKNVSVNFSPFWVSKAPKASKITITLQRVNSSNSGQ